MAWILTSKTPDTAPEKDNDKPPNPHGYWFFLFVVIISYGDFSRFSRDYIDAGDYLEQILPFLGVRFISVHDGYDSAIHGSLAGDVGNGFKNLYNSYYSKDLSRKVCSGLLTKKQSGAYTPSRCPYGYQKAVRAGIGMEIDEEVASVVRRIFAMSAEGVKPAKITRVLNLDGIPSPLEYSKQKNGGKAPSNTKSNRPLWTHDKVRSILSDIRYTGAFAYNMYKSVSIGTKDTNKMPQDKWELIPDAIPAIVTAEAFEKAQPAKRVRNGTNCGGAGKRPLARKLLCGGCGYALKVDVTKQTCKCAQRAYRDNADCVGSAVDMAVVENALTVAIQKMVDLCGSENIGSSGKSSRGIQMIRDVQRRIKAASDNKLVLYDQYCDGRLTREEYIGMRDAEDKVMEELNRELREAESSRAEPLSEMKERFCGLDWNGTLTREVAEALIEHVLVYDGGRLEIKWRFSSPISPEL